MDIHKLRFDTMLFEGNDFKNKGAVGTSSHQGLKYKIQRYKPYKNFRLVAEPFFPKGTTGNFVKNNPKGSLGVDVLIQYRSGGTWKNVLGLELKTGKGWPKTGVADRMKRLGTDIIQISIDVKTK